MSTDTPKPRSPRTVLVLENDSGRADTFSKALEKSEDLAVLSCAGPDDLLHRYHREHPTLVVIDASREETDVFEVLRELRRRARASQFLGVLALTNAADGPFAERLLKAGATDVFPVECDPVFLRSRVARMITSKAYHDDLAEALVDLAHERDIALRAVQSILPTELPAPSGWETAVIRRPGSLHASDFHDAFMLADGRLALTVADSIGSGLESFGPIATLQGVIYAALARGLSAGEVLALANRASLDIHGGESVLMVGLAVLNPETGELECAVAGDAAPLVHERPGSGVRWCADHAGPPLGTGDEARFETARVQLAPGGWILMATNGAYLVRNEAAEPLGAERFAATMQESADVGARELLDALEARIAAFAPEGSARDDWTVLVARRLPQQ